MTAMMEATTMSNDSTEYEDDNGAADNEDAN